MGAYDFRNHLLNSIYLEVSKVLLVSLIILAVDPLTLTPDL